MSELSEREEFNKKLKKDMKIKGIIIPVIFTCIVAIVVLIMANTHIGIFPSGKHDDSLTTTKPTETTEYMGNERL